VRPETKFRDTALAVNPNDLRYKEEIGKTYEIMGLLGPISMKVIADEEVNPEFGTGMMKVTPAHDFHDFDLGKKHNLPITPIIDYKGKMDFSWYLNQEKFDSLPEKYKQRAKMYHGLHVSKARLLMIEHLKEDGLIVKIDENYEHTVSVCYRCGTVLEPLPLPQFFLRVQQLTEKALVALEKSEVKIHGAGHDKILKHWLETLKDWNISRQIVWGIRLPVWYDTTKYPQIHVTFLDEQKTLQSGTIEELLTNYSLTSIQAGLQSLSAPIHTKFVVSEKSPGETFIQETDTFDTWFSSGQWPYATLLSQINSKFEIRNSKVSDENPNSDFNRFYPTQVMETAYDILPFWVMRMLMLGIHMTGKAPFQQVYFHGLVRDEKGQKMSKSKGNVINPLDIIDKYGADSLRMALVMSTSAGLDSNTGEGKIRGMRNFTNKIWNAARFIILNQTNEQSPPSHAELGHSAELIRSLSASQHKEIPKQVRDDKMKDEAYFKKLHEVSATITKQLEDLKVGLAAETLYNEFWHWFCDEAIEQAKKGEVSMSALTAGLKTFLKLLHPFVPFITEEIWSLLSNGTEESLMNTTWPTKVV
jgi:valyl-tRNA synthetase